MLEATVVVAATDDTAVAGVDLAALEELEETLGFWYVCCCGKFLPDAFKFTCVLSVFKTAGATSVAVAAEVGVVEEIVERYK